MGALKDGSGYRQQNCRAYRYHSGERGQFVREGEVLAKMDTRVLQGSDWKPSRKSKKRKAPLLPRGFAGATAKRNSRRTVAGQSTQAELDSVAKRHTRSRSLAQRELFLRNSWMTTAPPLRAPECAGISKSPGFCF